MKPEAKKQIVVSVTNDLVSDNRVHKVCSTLVNMGFAVLLVGRKLSGSKSTGKRSYATKRFRLLFNKGPLFYINYNLKLFLFLLFGRFDLLVSNDLDTLPANFLAAKIKKKPIIYDSHEFFTEVPELVHRPVVKRIWESLEQWMVPHVNAAYTVCDSIAGIYTERFKVPFRVVRNYPYAAEINTVNSTDEERNIVLYQGAVNMGRGLERVIKAIKLMEGVKLIIAGDGDKRTALEQLVEGEKLSDRVEFTGRLSLQDLAKLTPRAAVGLSIEEDIGLNYHYALPNKLFDYIQAQVPVLVSNLPEMAAVVKKYGIGEVLFNSDPDAIARILTEMIGDRGKRTFWKNNLLKASRELIWEKEERMVHQIFSPYL